MNAIYRSELAPIFQALRVPVAGESIPALDPVATPKTLNSHPVGIPYEDRPQRDLVREVNERLKAEDDRLRRLLPPAPTGHHWEGEITSDDHFDWVDMAASIAYRIRYRLIRDDGSDDG